MPRVSTCESGMTTYGRERKSLVTSKKLNLDSNRNDAEPRRLSLRVKKPSQLVVELQSTSPVKKAKNIPEKGSPGKVCERKVLAPLVSTADNAGKSSSPTKALIINLKTQQVTPRSPVSNASSLTASVEGRKTSPRKKLFTTDENPSPLKKTDAVKKPSFCSEIEPLDQTRSVVELGLKQPDIQQFSSARQALSTSHPDDIVGRRQQLKDMEEFLRSNFAQPKTKSKSKCTEVVRKSLYVSGPPGTGKTTCLKHLINTIPELVNGQVTCLFVNCMALGTSSKVFRKIAETITPKARQSQMESASDLKKFIENELTSSKKWILLVLDEIDQLESKCQEVLYTLFEWPYLTNSKLILVGIANALDLTDRILPRVMLRLASVPQEINFPAYSREEIFKIISTRIGQLNDDQTLIKPAAISFLAAKISALSGDVRKALDVCRRAIELSELEARKQSILMPLNSTKKSESRPKLTTKPIDIPQIMKIVNEVYCSSVTNSMSQKDSDLPLHQKLLIASLLLMHNYVKTQKEVTVGKLHETYSKICKKRGMTAASLSEVVSMTSLLESRGFVSLKTAKEAKNAKVTLRIDEEEVESAIRDKTLLCGILDDKECVSK